MTTVTDAEAYAGLAGIFEDLFLRDDIALRPDTTADQVEGWDSVRQVEIVIAVEERFDVRFSTRDLDGLRSVGDLAALIVRKAA